MLSGKFIPKVFGGVEVGAPCRPLEFFHSGFGKPGLLELAFVHRGIVMPEHVPMTGNKDILYSRVFSTLWHQFGERWVMVRCDGRLRTYFRPYSVL